MGYEVQELRRGSEEFIGYGNNPQYRVFALNLPKNQLTQLNEDAIDVLFCRLREEFHIKPEDCPIFFLYDRDVLSYKRNELRGQYVKKYTDPYGNEFGDQGQLLLSYPAIESYFDIDTITFGYARIYQPNVTEEEGVLVPVWDFFGERATFPEEERIPYTSDYVPPAKSLLTINAIDGSIIDRGLGY